MKGRKMASEMANEMRLIRNRWKTYLTGEGDANHHWLSCLNQKSSGLWESMEKRGDHLWPGLPLPIMEGVDMESRRISRNLYLTCGNLLTLAQACRIPGARWYGNKEVEDAVADGLNRINKRIYSAKESCPFFGNWWHWEIGAPAALLSTALILQDRLPDELLCGLTAAAKRYTYFCDRPSGYPGSPKMTAANLVDKGVVVLLWGVLTEDFRAMTHVREAVHSVLKYTDKGDGFYRDGSFIQHEALAYIGGYGKDLYEKFSLMSYVLKGSPFALQYEDQAEQILPAFLFQGVEPFLWQGKIMDMVSGRGVARPGQSDKYRGGQMLAALLPFYESLQEGEEKTRLAILFRHHLLCHGTSFFQYCSSPLAAGIGAGLMKDFEIPEYHGACECRFFPAMDKLVWRGETSAAALSMHSDRTYGHELINEEGKQTWHLSDGMLYLYGEEAEPYGGGFWGAADPTRLPGTTAEHVIHPSGAGDRETNLFEDVGSAVYGSYGLAGQHLKVLGQEGQRNGARARKSWFFFGEEILALGCGICSHTGQPVETIVENRRITQENQRLIADGREIWNGEENRHGRESLHKWAFLEEGIGGIGYISLDSHQICVLREIRRGNWITQGDWDKPVTEEFVTLWISHGCNPKEETYAYLLMTNTHRQQVMEEAKEPKVRILCNTKALQAAEKPEEGVTMLLFWEKPKQAVCGIKPENPAAVLVIRKEGKVTVAAADISRRLSGLYIEIDGQRKKLQFNQPGATSVLTL